MPKITKLSAIKKIEKSGMLLVFPIKNKPHLPSLWGGFYPEEQMVWDWSEEADGRVAALWHLRAELSDSRDVVYTKWFQNRATFFSLELFEALLSLASSKSKTSLRLSRDAERILDALEEDSPLPSKELKLRSELTGRENSSKFERAIRELWQRFLIVGFGEIDEGGYPSLAVGSSRLLFEESWDKSLKISPPDRKMSVERYLQPVTEFNSLYIKIEKLLN